MKTKIFLLVFFIFILMTSNGQIYMNSLGDLGIATSDPECALQVGDYGTDRAMLSVYHDASGQYPRGIFSYVEPYDSWTYGVMGWVKTGTAGANLVGVYANSYRGSTPTSTNSYGIYSLAGNGVDGYNYGVFGRLEGGRKGAGIFGTITSSAPYIDGKYAGYFNGDVHIEGDLTVDGDYPGSSDINVKKDIRNLEPNNVAKLQQLSGIKYKLIHPTLLPTFEKLDTVSLESLQFDMNDPKYTRDRIGLIAQDVQIVYPELVKTLNSGYLGLNYFGLIPILVEAIKEQQALIEELQSEVGQLKSSNSDLKSESINIYNTEPPINNSCTLYQNNPNPFDEDTEIKLEISEEIIASTLFVYNMQGRQIRSYNIQERGLSSVIINGYELDPGMYLYALITDGKEVGTKRMILTD